MANIKIEDLGQYTINDTDVLNIDRLKAREIFDRISQ